MDWLDELDTKGVPMVGVGAEGVAWDGLMDWLDGLDAADVPCVLGG